MVQFKNDLDSFIKIFIETVKKNGYSEEAALYASKGIVEDCLMNSRLPADNCRISRFSLQRSVEENLKRAINIYGLPQKGKDKQASNT